MEEVKNIYTLSIEHLIPYLPFMLEGISPNTGTKFYLGHFSNMLGKGTETRTIETWLDDGYKPLLYPLDILDRDIFSDNKGSRISGRKSLLIDLKSLGYFSLNDYYKALRVIDDLVISGFQGNHHFGELPYFVINWLAKNHFDFQGLINKGLAISKVDNLHETDKGRNPIP